MVGGAHPTYNHLTFYQITNVLPRGGNVILRYIVNVCMLMVCLIPVLWGHASAADLGAAELGAELALAAKKGDLQAVRKLLDRGVDIEAAGEEMGSTALNAACFWGHLDIVRLLLARGGKHRGQK